MNCPKCQNIKLTTREIRSISIDSCPACGGAWLQSHELDRISEHPHATTRSVSIPSVMTQKQDEYDVVYDGIATPNIENHEQEATC